MKKKEFNLPTVEVVLVTEEVIKTSGEVAWWNTDPSGQDA